MDGMKAQSDYSKRIWMRVGLKKMISITMVIRTAFALMLSTVFIRRFVVTPANIHDDYVWADSAYSGEHF